MMLKHTQKRRQWQIASSSSAWRKRHFSRQPDCQHCQTVRDAMGSRNYTIMDGISSNTVLTKTGAMSKLNSKSMPRNINNLWTKSRVIATARINMEQVPDLWAELTFPSAETSAAVGHHIHIQHAPIGAHRMFPSAY
jgi:hypothetical protein